MCARPRTLCPALPPPPPHPPFALTALPPHHASSQPPQAEARRRSRINERLEALRQVRSRWGLCHCHDRPAAPALPCAALSSPAVHRAFVPASTKMFLNTTPPPPPVLPASWCRTPSEPTPHSSWKSLCCTCRACSAAWQVRGGWADGAGRSRGGGFRKGTALGAGRQAGAAHGVHAAPRGGVRQGLQG